MSKRTRLLLFMVAIPILCLLAIMYTRSTMQSDWVEAVREQTGAAAQEIRPLAEICLDPEAASIVTEPCDVLAKLSLIQTGAFVALGVGLFLPALIALAGHLARNRRQLLWQLFKPLLYFTAFGTSVIMLLQAALFSTTAWYTLHWGLKMISAKGLFIIFTFAFIAVVGVFSMINALFKALRASEGHEHAWLVTRESQPALWAFVDNLAAAAKTEPPRQILLGLDPSFYVTESPMICRDERLTGRTLFLSLPFCRILTESELAAIIGHELAHFQGEDTLFSQRFYPIYRQVGASLGALVQINGQERHFSPLLPAIYLLDFFIDAFETAESEISRTREFAADALGATLTAPRIMGSALVKVHAFGPQWEKAVETQLEGMKKEVAVSNVGSLFGVMMTESAEPSILQGLDEKAQPHPVDSHPPLRQRLGALHLSLAELTEEALTVTPDQPAIALIAQTQSIEEELTAELNEAFKLHLAQMARLAESEEGAEETN